MFLCYSSANWHTTARCVRSQDYKLALERPAGHLQFKWGQAYVVGKISPPPLVCIGLMYLPKVSGDKFPPFPYLPPALGLENASGVWSLATKTHMPQK